MGVKIYNKTKDITFKPFYDDLHKIFKATLSKLHINKKYDLSVILVRSKFIQDINKTYRKIDKATDVITFAMLDDTIINEEENSDLGDIYINVDYIYLQAKEYGHSLRREFCFLFTHGLLHSLGYDHMSKEDEDVMFRLQDEILEPLVKR